MKWTDGRKQKPARKLIERAVNLCGLLPEVWERRTTLRALWWSAYKRGYRAGTFRTTAAPGNYTQDPRRNIPTP